MTPWEVVLARCGGRYGVLAAFAVCDALLLWFAYLLLPVGAPGKLAIMWPATGLLFCALWLSDRSFWTHVMVAHLLVGGLFAYAMNPNFPSVPVVGYWVSNLLEAFAATAVAWRMAPRPTRVSLALAGSVALAVATGSLVGALASAWINVTFFGSPQDYLHQAQIWWASKFLGYLTVVPVLIFWLLPMQPDRPELALRSRGELAILLGLIVLSTWLIFRDWAGSVLSLLQLPFFTLGLLVYGAVRLPPRWAAALAALVALTGAYMSTRHAMPFLPSDPVLHTLQLQLFLTMCNGLTTLLAVLFAEKNQALVRTRESEARLLLEQQRLQFYAHQVVAAEESGRRTTATELHDRVGQTLAGMAMTLDVAQKGSTPELRPLLEDLRAHMGEVQEQTRRLIADLSPPGLYDMGLLPALQWLGNNLQQHEGLRVDIDASVQEEVLDLEARILVFKLVRELLRNVSRYAGVNIARVQLRGDREFLRVEVSDKGVGFEWQPDAFASCGRGVGLWSIATRVQEVGGRFTVDATPGRGSRFEIVLPLQEVQSSEVQDAVRRQRRV